MSVYLKNFMKYRSLLEELTARDVKIKYKHSVLGVLWTLLNPLLMMLVLSAVFSNLFRFDIENFSLYILSGQVIFNFFNDATTNAMTAIVGNAALIKKVYVPKYMFVLSRVISSFINLLASFAALIIVMIITRAELHWTVLLSFVPMLLVVFMALGIGLMLSTVTVKFRDMMHLYSVLMTVLLYLTPVIYPVSILPEWLYDLVMLNPLTVVITMFRDLMLYDTMFSIETLGIAFAETVVFMALGICVFHKKQDEFILNL